MIPTLLGGLSAQEFLRDYWQKKPLLVRGAVPGFGTLLDRTTMLDLACRDDAEARLISNDEGNWDVRRGPFAAKDFRRRKDLWTVLLQGVNLLLPEGNALLREFSFIPHARLDDLMVSYAVDGAGVGPHFDSYDVFLLQGTGTRRWRISKQKDLRLRDDVPLKILSHFKTEEEWLLEPGDMLYLPPQYAHDGIAVGDCMTWSIGFRAPPAQELMEGFLSYLQERTMLPGRYADPDLPLQKHPAEIGKGMIAQVESMLTEIKWNTAIVRDFLGTYLTEPKPHVYFEPPEKPLTFNRFATQARRHGVHLDAKTQLLFSGNVFYINGEECVVERTDQTIFRALADNRTLAVCDNLSESGLDLLHAWYEDGFLRVGKTA
ncbi:MAG TPA: cupin domain-containing protein [Rhodocyclaceae bacterium]|nr:cupin domain-containing protein [Rhodocyclaceae bacterium]